jgi:hypothetical protein
MHAGDRERSGQQDVKCKPCQRGLEIRFVVAIKMGQFPGEPDVTHDHGLVDERQAPELPHESGELVLSKVRIAIEQSLDIL